MRLFILFRITNLYSTITNGEVTTYKDVEYVTDDRSFLITMKEQCEKDIIDSFSTTSFEIEEISEFSFHFETTNHII